MRYAFPVLLVIFVIAFALGGLLNTNTIYVYEKPTMWGSQYVFEPYSSNITNPNMTSARVVVPAVDDNGVGVPTVLLVQVVPGSGKSLVNIDRLFFWVDTQNSIRTAMHVAENILGMNLSKKDIVYTIRANASIVEGPSAGAALTVATIAALEGAETNRSVMMTGTIREDGTIGPVGGVLEKAKAAASIGAKKLLVPPGQSVEITYETKKNCRQMGWTEYCSTETVQMSHDVAEESGIHVVEVQNVRSALGHFYT